MIRLPLLGPRAAASTPPSAVTRAATSLSPARLPRCRAVVMGGVVAAAAAVMMSVVVVPSVVAGTRGAFAPPPPLPVRGRVAVAVTSPASRRHRGRRRRPPRLIVTGGSVVPPPARGLVRGVCFPARGNDNTRGGGVDVHAGTAQRRRRRAMGVGSSHHGRHADQLLFWGSRIVQFQLVFFQ